MKNKYIYLINGESVTREKFKSFLACEVFPAVSSVGWVSIGCADYERAEKEIKRLQKQAQEKNVIVVRSSGSYQVKIEGGRK